jgi:hypothetical protein
MIRLRNAVHYIIHSQTDFAKLGKVKLNKILWFADREMMYNTGLSITHTSYIKLQNGPVPKKIEQILSALEKEKKIVRRDVFVNGYTQNSFISIDEPDISDFSAVEISIFDKRINEVIAMSAKQVSDLSHDCSWKLAKMGEIMPVETVFLTDICKPTQQDIEEAKQFFATI